MVTEVKGQTLGPFWDCLTLKKKRQISYTDTSVNICLHTLYNIPKQRRNHSRIRLAGAIGLDLR